jgi:hypothetical protein
MVLVIRIAPNTCLAAEVIGVFCYTFHVCRQEALPWLTRRFHRNGCVRMSEQQTPPPDAALQILITEHTNLQAARSATIFEANGRTTLFLGAVSSGIVALAFIGQTSELGSAFFLFALILLPSLLFLGLVTFIRVNQTGIEDMVAARGINRIRHYYTEVAPQIAPYFILSTHDDMLGYLQNLGGQASIFQQFVSTAGLVSVINGVLAAVFVGLLLFTLFQTSFLVCLVAGGVVFGACVFFAMRYQHRHWATHEQRLKVLFPSGQQPQS